MLTLFDQEHVLNVERDNIRAVALAEGISQGISQGRSQVIVNMFRHNMSMQDIADINDLPVEEVSAILKKAAVLH